ncbi:MAG: hypothetical protein J5I93_03875 [Pirellulaceae bacterium]|nr:hypothetical protein [Pirellulaceae bacterium]
MNLPLWRAYADGASKQHRRGCSAITAWAGESGQNAQRPAPVVPVRQSLPPGRIAQREAERRESGEPRNTRNTRKEEEEEEEGKEEDGEERMKRIAAVLRLMNASG